jgi:hypothetical protein
MFNHLATITTDIQHIHKIPLKLARKIFAVKSDGILYKG